MIFDSSINEHSAKYWCAFANCAFDNVSNLSKKEMSKPSAMKDAITAAMATEQAKKMKNAGKLDESFLTEGFIDFVTSLWNAPPAWVEEPTGFNKCSPKDVFKDDVQAGLAGYKRGQNIGAAAALTTVGAGIPVIRNAVKTLAKTAVKNPGTATGVATATTVAINNPKETAIVVKAFANVIKWCSSHAVSLSAAGAIAYGLYQTSSLWLPYIKRLAYEATCGKPLAFVEFEVDGKSYRFEYSQKKHTWRMLNSGKLSSPEDVESFIKTDFAKAFVNRCKQIIQNAIDHIDMLKSQAELSGNKAAISAALWLESNQDKLKTQMFKCKVSH